MELRERVENFIEDGNTIEWAAGFAVKHTVEFLISAFTAILLTIPVAFVVPFLPMPGIDIAIYGLSASLEDLTRVSGFAVVWIPLCGVFYVGTRCNYP